MLLGLIYCHLSFQYDAVGWTPKEYNPDDKQSTGWQEQVAGSVAVQRDGSALHSGFVWDEASGYYFDAASGFYYDGNTGLLLHFIEAFHDVVFLFLHISSQYYSLFQIECPSFLFGLFLNYVYFPF